MLAICWDLGLSPKWLGKHTLFKPPFGWVMRALGGLPVDRGNPAGLVDEIVVNLDSSNHEAAIELAALPEQIRGYGHVRERYLAGARKRQAALLEDFRQRRAPSTPLATKARRTIAIIPG